MPFGASADGMTEGVHHIISALLRGEKALSCFVKFLIVTSSSGARKRFLGKAPVGL